MHPHICTYFWVMLLATKISAADLFFLYFPDIPAYIELRDDSVLHLSLDVVSRLLLVDKAEDGVGNEALHPRLSQVAPLREGQSAVTTPAQNRTMRMKNK